MKKALIVTLCLILVAAVMLPCISLAENYGYYWIKAGRHFLNVRSTAEKIGDNRSDPNNNIVDLVSASDCVLVYEFNYNRTWAYIEGRRYEGNGTTKGWVMASLLQKSKPDPNPNPSPVDPTADDSFTTINKAAKALKLLDEPYITVIKTQKATNLVHLRWFPDTNAAYNGAYLCDTEIEVLAQSKTWTQVRVVEDGHVGFILTRCVAESDI